jgi:serine/threonine protein kinase
MSNEKANLIKYEPLFGRWKTDKLIGEGSYSGVYKIKDYSSNYSAVKFIRIPSSNLYSDALSSFGSRKKKLNLFFFDLVTNIEHYANTISTINDPYILDYQDHTIVKLTEKTGWDFIIKMEDLISLQSHLKYNELTMKDLLLISIDICMGLSRYRLKNIFQTNISEENVFISESGTYKIGDFSLSNQIKRNTWGNTFLSKPFNLSPELFAGKSKDETSDIYSLGIFLYKLLNNGRFPFLPRFPREITDDDIKSATKSRLKGEFMAPPVNSPNKLSNIVQKCCAFKITERYKDPLDVKNDLESFLSSLTENEKNKTILFPSYNFESTQASESESMHFADDPERTIAYDETYIPKQYSVYLEDEFLQEKTYNAYSDTFKMIQSHKLNLNMIYTILNKIKNKFLEFIKILKKNK